MSLLSSPDLPYSLLLLDADAPRRNEIECFIAQRYRQAFNAEVPGFMPYLVAVVDDQNRLCSACGFRPADTGPLYLEHYLDRPAEQVMSELFKRPIDRSKLVEFGQLASFSKGAAPLQFLLLARLLVKHGYEWCIFTATGPLFAMMQRMGLEPLSLVNAAQDQLGDEGTVWGNYYHHAPRVSCGYLGKGLATLEENMTRGSAKRVANGCQGGR